MPAFPGNPRWLHECSPTLRIPFALEKRIRESLGILRRSCRTRRVQALRGASCSDNSRAALRQCEDEYPLILDRWRRAAAATASATSACRGDDRHILLPVLAHVGHGNRGRRVVEPGSPQFLTGFRIECAQAIVARGAD